VETAEIQSRSEISKDNLARWVQFSFLLLFSLITTYPLFWMFTVALKTNAEQVRNPLGLPRHPTLESFTQLLQDQSIIQYTFNSAFITLVSVVLVLILGSLAGYSLARMEFKGRGIILFLFLTVQWIPLVVLVIPLLVTVQYLGLYGTRISLIFAYVSANLGLAVFLMRGFFRSIPQELLDAAVLDGCDDFKAFLYVMLPQVRAGIAVVAIVSFISIWNEYFIALVLVADKAQYTLPLGISAFHGMYGTDWPKLGAALLLATLPTLVTYIFFAENFIRSTSRSVGFGGR